MKFNRFEWYFPLHTHACEAKKKILTNFIYFQYRSYYHRLAVNINLFRKMTWQIALHTPIILCYSQSENRSSCVVLIEGP